MRKAEKITYSNWVLFGNRVVRLEDLLPEEREKVANSLIYRPLATLPNVEITQTA